MIPDVTEYDEEFNFDDIESYLNEIKPINPNENDNGTREEVEQ